MENKPAEEVMRPEDMRARMDKYNIEFDKTMSLEQVLKTIQETEARLAKAKPICRETRCWGLAYDPDVAECGRCAIAVECKEECLLRGNYKEGVEKGPLGGTPEEKAVRFVKEATIRIKTKPVETEPVETETEEPTPAVETVPETAPVEAAEPEVEQPVPETVQPEKTIERPEGATDEEKIEPVGKASGDTIDEYGFRIGCRQSYVCKLIMNGKPKTMLQLQRAVNRRFGGEVSNHDVKAAIYKLQQQKVPVKCQKSNLKYYLDWTNTNDNG